MRMKRALAEPARKFRHTKGEAPSRRKKPANVSIDAEILAAAKAQGINLSAVLEEELRKRVQDARVKKWQKENRAVFESYNKYIERNGIFGEELLDLDDPSV
jgi:antitoxin CcdA